MSTATKMTRAVLITGATGRQGGALIRSLLASKSDFQIIAVSRDTTSASAQKLAARSSQISLVQGNLDDSESIFKNAKKVTSLPIWGVFSVQLPVFNKEGAAIEERQGKSLVDAAIKHGVSHFVYSSVDRHGELSTKNPTNVPHFATKHNIEHHLIDAAKSSSMTYTILRPVAFMENFDGGFTGKVFAASWRTVIKSRPLQLVATDDIGAVAANAFLDLAQFKNVTVSLAGDELTYDQMVQVFKNKTGSAPPATFGFVARGVNSMVSELGLMFGWFETQGYAADIAAVKKIYPEIKDLATWLDEKKTNKSN